MRDVNKHAHAWLVLPRIKAKTATYPIRRVLIFTDATRQEMCVLRKVALDGLPGEIMKTNLAIAASLMIVSTILAGCASPSRPLGSTAPATSYSTTYGTVDSIQVVQTSSGNGSGVGTVAGGVVGGALGNQVGEGRGRTAATVAGAIGGAMVGNQMEKNASGNQVYQIGVRLDNGSYQTVQQDAVGDLQVGSRVRIENGRAYRY
jgi:outer membrane lipoprotein SlyB